MSQSLTIWFPFQIKKSTSFVEENIDEELIDRKETQAAGAVKLTVYKSFLDAVNNSCYVVTVIIMFFVAQILYSGADYFVSQW